MFRYLPPGHVQFGLLFSCAKQGCEQTLGRTHRENGRVFEIDAAEVGTVTTINGHACELVSRTMPAWTPAPVAAHAATA